MNAIAIEKALSATTNHADKSRDDRVKKTGDLSQGDAPAQGDLAFVRFDCLPSTAIMVEKPALQLAPGSTLGSRHTLDSLDGKRVYVLSDATPLDGPIIVSDRDFKIRHPEHGDWKLKAGITAVIYQRKLAAEKQRVQD